MADEKSKKKKRTGKPPIEIDPPAYPVEPQKVNESKDTWRIDALIKLGLGEPSKLMFYRHAMVDPKQAITQIQYRPYVAEVLDRLLDVILNDMTAYNRIRTLLHLHEDMDEDEVEPERMGYEQRQEVIGRLRSVLKNK